MTGEAITNTQAMEQIKLQLKRAIKLMNLTLDIVSFFPSPT